MLNNYKNQCVPECHPTCSTCSVDDPSYCLSCNGIRMNAPECTCPAGYFDDGITPECICKIISNDRFNSRSKYWFRNIWILVLFKWQFSLLYILF